MGTLKIKKYPDAVLREPCKLIEDVGSQEIKILDDMVYSMRVHEGIGLAAPQVGIPRQLIVVDIGEGAIKLANPRRMPQRTKPFPAPDQ